MPNNIPWYDDWWTVKCNEFERGVLTGMLLTCGKSEEPSPQQPTGGANWVWHKTPSGILIETWTYSKGTFVSDGHTWDKQYLKQRKTYSDGTYLEKEQMLSTYYDWGIDITTFDWWLTFKDPNSSGNIDGAIFYWSVKSDPEQVYSMGISFTWGMPTTEPKVIL